MALPQSQSVHDHPNEPSLLFGPYPANEDERIATPTHPPPEYSPNQEYSPTINSFREPTSSSSPMPLLNVSVNAFMSSNSSESHRQDMMLMMHRYDSAITLPDHSSPSPSSKAVAKADCETTTESLQQYIVSESSKFVQTDDIDALMLPQQAIDIAKKVHQHGTQQGVLIQGELVLLSNKDEDYECEEHENLYNDEDSDEQNATTAEISLSYVNNPNTSDVVLKIGEAVYWAHWRYLKQYEYFQAHSRFAMTESKLVEVRSCGKLRHVVQFNRVLNIRWNHQSHINSQIFYDTYIPATWIQYCLYQNEFFQHF